MNHWITLFDRTLDFNMLTYEDVKDAAAYSIVHAKKGIPMDKTRIEHSWFRLDDPNIPDSEKVNLLISLVKDLSNRISSLEADVDILSEDVIRNTK